MCIVFATEEFEQDNTANVPDLETVGNYAIEKDLGHGGQGDVMLVHEIGKPQVKYALKEFRRGRVKDFKEAFTLQRLNHKHIIEYRNVFEEGRKKYLLMEFAKHGSLYGIIEKRKSQGPWQKQVIKYVFIQILDGMIYLHKVARICHRDLKTMNVLVTEDATGQIIIKLCDFGLAKEVDHTSASMHSHCGTGVYMPPEIADERGSYTMKCDVWSLGCIFTQIIKFEIKQSVSFCSLIISRHHLFSCIRIVSGILYEVCMLKRTFRSPLDVLKCLQNEEVPEICEDPSNGENWKDLRKACSFMMELEPDNRRDVTELSKLRLFRRPKDQIIAAQEEQDALKQFLER